MALHLAQPTVSTQIARLSEAVGARLFEQIGRQLHLTDVGQELFGASRELFEVLDRLEMRLAQRAGLSLGRLRLGAVTTSKYLIPAWLGSFCKMHPGIEPELQVGNRAEIIRRLQQNLDDLYVFSHPPQDEPIDAEPLTENPLVVIAPREHPLANASPSSALSWDALSAERLLVREEGSGTRYAIERHFDQHGLRHPRTTTVASNEAIKEAVVAGLGLAILSRHALRHMAPDNLVELPVQTFPIPNSWYLVTLKGKQLSPAAQAFRDHVRLQCAASGGQSAKS